MATYSSPWDWYRAQGAATFSGVVSPAPTSESTASGVALANKTFSSFTDPNSLISSYTAVTLNTTGSCSWSGSGLGPYTPTSADGDAGSLGLQAKDSGGNVLAVALHSYARGASGGGSGTGALVELFDFTGVSYNFLTTGGTSGTGGEGPHTVNGISVTLSYNGTSGPDALAFVNGVLQHTGNVSTKQSYLIFDVGEDVDTVPLVVNVSTDNLATSSSQSFIWRVSVSGSPGSPDNTLAALYGYTGSAASDTAIFFRESNGGGSYTTIQALSGLTDITTTPTRTAIHVLSGSALVSYDQGTATLPTDGTVYTNQLTKNLGIGTGATNRQNRRYVHIFCLEDVNVQLNAYKLEETILPLWATDADIDLSDGDITDLNLTKGAGNTNIRNSADTETRVVAGYLDTVNTSNGTCVASTANAGIRLSNSQNNSEAAQYWLLDAATYGQDMSALDKTYLLNVRVRNASIGSSTNDTIGIWCSSTGNFRSAGLAFGIQQYRSGSNFIFRGIRAESGTQYVGSSLQSSASVQTDYVCTFVIYRGRLADSFVTLGTTMPTEIPTAGGSVLHTPQGVSTVAIDTGPSAFTDVYAMMQVYSGGGSSAATIDAVELLELTG